uniref:Uncharacterized protein n=1 Tax=Pseudonaja textilis TaxID=8673 RepID=A0A670ZPE8_PSETE
MHQAYSPKKKEAHMLKVCKMLYEAMNLHLPFGADDFLPVLIYMLVRCDVVSVQLDVEYMMELMDPNQLQGEGSFHLPLSFSFFPPFVAFDPFEVHRWDGQSPPTSVVTGSLPSFQHTLYVSFHEPFNNQKIVSVPPDMTTALVCAACAEKYGVSDGAAYGLFLVSDSSTQLLPEDSCPQKVRADLLQREGSVNFVYKPKNSTLPAAGSGLLRETVDLTEPRNKPLERVGMEHLEAD